ncbi:MAG TPA: hypothetical protein VGP42_01220 [Stellaceae bacterium]|nr:hypothetical protein [Stellaceae bacterium]
MPGASLTKRPAPQLAARPHDPGDRRWLAQALATPRAEAIGHDANIDAVVQAFIEDDLPLQKQLSG